MKVRLGRTAAAVTCCSIIHHSFAVIRRVDDHASTLPTAPAHVPRRALARIVSMLASAFGWLMCSLAAGAAAAFAALAYGMRPSWAILVLALPLTWLLKVCGCLQPRWAAPVAAAAVLLAGFYAEMLAAVTRIAAATGFPFGLAFRTAGVQLTLNVAELGLNALSVLVYAAAAVAAAVVGAWLARPSTRR